MEVGEGLVAVNEDRARNDLIFTLGTNIDLCPNHHSGSPAYAFNGSIERMIYPIESRELLVWRGGSSIGCVLM
jgi:hypothetical protein